jgi:hypothetical protein
MRFYVFTSAHKWNRSCKTREILESFIYRRGRKGVADETALLVPPWLITSTTRFGCYSLIRTRFGFYKLAKRVLVSFFAQWSCSRSDPNMYIVQPV